MNTHILTQPDPAFDFAPPGDGVLVALIKAQIEKEDRLTAIHRAEGDKAKMRAAMQTATVLRRILREASTDAADARRGVA
jgi:regulator of protease activity HflC (stomatin/prohibitin superfamily)